MNDIEVQVLADARTIASAAADLFTEQVRANPATVLGLATGSTPLATYAELIRRHREEGLDFGEVTAFLLDEYLGLPAGHPERYREVIWRDFCGRAGFDPAKVKGPPGDPGDDLAARCRAYEESIAAAGGVDLQILGLGADGHIAFNMPGAPFGSTTRPTWLSMRTIADNARFFGDDPDQVPRQAVTQGLSTILRARKIVLLATGATKAEAVQAMVTGPVGPEVPATALRAHPDTVVLLDPAAAALLP